jgi:hypothetical protein
LLTVARGHDRPRRQPSEGDQVLHRLGRSRLALAGVTLAFAVPVGATVTPVADAASYPSAVKKAYTKSCVKSAKKAGAPASKAKKYCASALKCLEKNLSLKEFNELGVALNKGDKTPPHGKVLKRCQKKAQASVS